MSTSLPDEGDTIPTAFVRQADRCPDRIALRSGGSVWTYGELNRRADGVAAELRRRGVQAGAPVALLMRHDAPMVAGILGVLKAGAVSLSLDRTHPAARLRRILHDTRPAWLLSDEPAGDADCVAGSGTRLLDANSIATAAPPDQSEPQDPRAPAFLYFTSGSAGQPKGVVHGHRSVLHGVGTDTAQLGIVTEDRLALLHSSSIAASRLMLFGGLLNGATVCLFDIRREGISALPEWMRAEGITVCHMVPSLFRMLASALPKPGALSAIRAVKLGGEPVSLADVNLYRDRFSPGCVLVNGLGATEFGGGNVCALTIRHETAVPGPLVPIGYPAQDVDLRLIDDDGRECADGDAGEIVIRSDYLALGYWNDPDGTRRAFAPLGAEPDDTMPAFRTGDLGRRDANGCITHLGRKDQLVKIRGHRVELVEVEAGLGQLDGIAAAAVTVRRDPSGDASLVGFYVASTSGAMKPAAIRDALGQLLPRYMIPPVLVETASLPALAGGKIDRNALAAMAHDAAEAAAPAGVPVPRGDVLQLQLKGIWERALKTRDIGIRDDFFAMGGDSLAAADICSLVERDLGIRLPLSMLIDAPTIVRLAGAIRDRGLSASWSPLVALQPNGPHPAVYCIPGAGSDVFALQDLARHLGPDQPFYGLQPRGLDGAAPFHRTVESLAAYYIEAVRRHQPAGPYFVAGTSYGGKAAFEMARQLQSAGQTIGIVALLDAYGPAYPQVSPAITIRQRLMLLLEYVMPRYLAHLTIDAWLAGALSWRALKGYLRMAARYWRAKCYVSLPEGFVTRPFDLRFECLQAVSFAATANYRPAPFTGRLDLFRTEHQPADALFADDPELGWHGLATRGVHVSIVPGRHSEHIREPHVAVLAATLRDALAQARLAAAPLHTDRAIVSPTGARE